MKVSSRNPDLCVSNAPKAHHRSPTSRKSSLTTTPLSTSIAFPDIQPDSSQTPSLFLHYRHSLSTVATTLPSQNPPCRTHVPAPPRPLHSNNPRHQTRMRTRRRALPPPTHPTRIPTPHPHTRRPAPNPHHRPPPRRHHLRRNTDPLRLARRNRPRRQRRMQHHQRRPRDTHRRPHRHGRDLGHPARAEAPRLPLRRAPPRAAHLLADPLCRHAGGEDVPAGGVVGR